MKFLVLCHKPPFPAVDGGSIAMYNLLKGLKKSNAEVDVLAMSTFKQPCNTEEQEKFEQEIDVYSLVDVDIRIKPFDALINLFTTQSYNISRFISPQYSSQLESILKLKKYDVVLFESLFSTPYVELVRSLHNGLLVHRSHNVEFNIWQNLAENEQNPLKKWYLKLLSKRLKKYELEVVNEFDLVATISQSDIIEYRNNGIGTLLYHLPFGIDLSAISFQKSKPSRKVKIYHVGSMNWIPHQKAFRWFFDHVWSEIDSLKDEIELHLAGTDMPKWIEEKSTENLIVKSGYVNGFEYAKDKEILIVPSFSGSGIRIKIIEAMASGKTIITTKNGAMGINCLHGENILISDRPEDWIEYIAELVHSPQKRETLSMNARQFCFDFHDHVMQAQQFINKLHTTKPKQH